MRCILATFSVLCIHISLEDGPINYCGAKMCAHTNAHTFCRYPVGPDPSCIGYIDAHLSFEEKALVIARMNRRRSEAARGLNNWPTAGDMLKLRWVKELAREAQRWADQCRPPSTPEYYDGCHSITVGQGVASVVGEAPGLRPETMVDLWYMQSMLYKGNVASYKPPENSKSYYGDFAQLIWSRTYMVGCGRSRFMTPWNGRLRSVERLVCNFAPRGPVSQSALWTPAPTASLCPARSRPDTNLPDLCTFQEQILGYALQTRDTSIIDSSMDETYDEDNTMSLEEHLVLNTILAIERNSSLDYLGSLDEIYLTKLAVATIESPIITVPPYNSLHKRDLVEKLNLDGETTQYANKTKLEENFIVETTSKFNYKNKKLKKKYNIIGRPKTYAVDDLNESDNLKIDNYNKVPDTTTTEIDMYDDYEFVEREEEMTVPTTTAKTNHQYNGESTPKQKQEIYNNTNIVSETIVVLRDVSNITKSTEAFEMFLNNIISNLTIPQILNESAIDANILDDYLSDPETVRQLQDVLDRMERNLATNSTSGKVRRELRSLEQSNEPNILKSAIQAVKPEQLGKIGRNQSIDRGPMLNMVLKYMPYLKTYEKRIIGDTINNFGCVSSPSIILFLALYI